MMKESKESREKDTGIQDEKLMATAELFCYCEGKSKGGIETK